MRRFHALLALLLVSPTSCGSDGTTPIDGSNVPNGVDPIGAAITVDPGTTFQTIIGWEGTAQAGQVDCAGFASYRDGVFDRLVNEVGINGVRLEIESGTESTKDWFPDYKDGKISENEWVSHRYEIVNDNPDPFVVNPAGFQFGHLDDTIEQVVNPMRQRLAARGEKLHVNLNYVDFEKTAFEHRTNPEEYAEFMLVTFQHIQSKYGWTPDALELILEPDNNTGWTGTDIGRVIVATGDRLKAAGFHPAMIAPSTMVMAASLPYLTQILAVPRASEYLKEVSYHRYGTSPGSTLKQIGDRVASLGLQSGMLEKKGAGYEELYADLSAGRNSAWQQYTLAYCGSGDKGGAYYTVSMIGSSPTYTMGSRTKLLRQYFLYIRSGAVRLGATSGSNDIKPLAFRNADGRFVVVVKTEGDATFHITGVPSGAYGITYSTESEYDVELPDVTFDSTHALNAAIPAAGVITIHQR